MAGIKLGHALYRSGTRAHRAFEEISDADKPDLLLKRAKSRRLRVSWPETTDRNLAFALAYLSKVVGRLHPQPHVSAAANPFSKRTAISGVTALLPPMTL